MSEQLDENSKMSMLCSIVEWSFILQIGSVGVSWQRWMVQ